MSAVSSGGGTFGVQIILNAYSRAQAQADKAAYTVQWETSAKAEVVGQAC